MDLHVVPQYSRDDLERAAAAILQVVKPGYVINQINHLRTKEKLTIAGARTRLMMRKAGERKKDLVASAKARTLIGQMRKDIEQLLKLFS